MTKWYGCINNRLEENQMYTKQIEVGTGMTEYLWSDRHPYEVTKVLDQKHVTVRGLDHKKADDTPFDNTWNLISNPNNPEMDLVKRGNYWYKAMTCTPEFARQAIEEHENDTNGRGSEKLLWIAMNGWDAREIAAGTKARTRYIKMNVSFGHAEYYYDYEF